VGVVYKGWGVERKLHSSYGIWNNKEKSQTNMPKFKENPKLGDEMVSLAKNETTWPTIINMYNATHPQRYDIIHCS